MPQQTAVEYIIEKLQSAQWEYTPWPERRKIIEQAKQMEKEQHNETWEKGRLEDKGDDYLGKQLSFEQYYNETYKIN